MVFKPFAHDVLKVLEKSLMGKRVLQRCVEEQDTKSFFSSSLISPGCTSEVCALSCL